ncbi:GPIX protein, partial [Atractosteus spatula]|nr:GPIX protein [Atractosteus spatula]
MESLLPFLFLMLFHRARTCPTPCTCTLLGTGELHVGCSSLGLHTIPTLPDSTVSLNLQYNQLTTVAPGSFDKLRNLRTLQLSHNPWVCDCDIVYLKHWLEDNKVNVMVEEVKCAKPAHTKGRAITQLHGNEFPGCNPSRKLDCSGYFQRFMILAGIALLSLLLMAWLTWCSKRLLFLIAKKPL